MTNIEEKNPLKQGLKPGVEYNMIQPSGIEEKNPLKQGLKQFELISTISSKYN